MVSFKFETYKFQFIFDFKYFNMNINIASINVNGLNSEKKQMLLHAFINQHKLDIVYIQEHNIREDGKITFLERFYQVIMNKSINIKGGTCILIRKSLSYILSLARLSFLLSLFFAQAL